MGRSSIRVWLRRRWYVAFQCSFISHICHKSFISDSWWAHGEHLLFRHCFYDQPHSFRRFWDDELHVLGFFRGPLSYLSPRGFFFFRLIWLFLDYSLRCPRSENNGPSSFFFIIFIFIDLSGVHCPCVQVQYLRVQRGCHGFCNL